MYQDSHYGALYLPVLLITPSCPFSVISFFHPSGYRMSLPYLISSLLYRSPLLHFLCLLCFLRRYFDIRVENQVVRISYRAI